jgi:uncharacterized membrane protein (DUF2068 family)
LRLIAVLEAVKGALVLLVGLGLPGLEGNRKLRHYLTDIVRHFHLNPAHHTPRIFVKLQAATQMDRTHLIWLACAASAYALVRFVEAYGLWFQRRWAEWVSCIGAAIYVPVEVWHLVHHGTWITFGVLLANVVIVIYLVACLVTGHTKAKAQATAPSEVQTKP